MIKWSNTSEGWLKVNTNGATNMQSEAAVAGGVVRDHSGTWLAGFLRNIRDCSILEAEV